MRGLRAQGGRPGAGAEHPLLEEGLGGAQRQVGRQEGRFFRERGRVGLVFQLDEPNGAVMGKILLKGGSDYCIC